MMKKYSQNKSDTYKSQGDRAIEKFTEMMIDRMESIKASDWKQGWVNGTSSFGAMPQNLTGRNYSGINSFFLQIHTAMNGYKAPIYMTFLQTTKEKAQIKKGAESIPAVYWDLSIKDKDGHRVSKEDFLKLPVDKQKEMDVYPFLKSYNVFNIDQTNLAEVNKEKYERLVGRYKVELKEDSVGMYKNEALDRMFSKQEWLCPIHTDKPSNNAYYSPSQDIIVLPTKAQFKIGKTVEDIFKDGMEYYATALHEMAHSTGAKKRLDRTIGDRFGDKKYAKEELVAELSAALIGNSLGFDKRILNNNAAYLDGWIQTLKQEPKFIVSVMSDVNKASSMIMDFIEKQQHILQGEDNKIKQGKSIADIELKFDRHKKISDGVFDRNVYAGTKMKNQISSTKQEKASIFENASVFKMKNGDYAVRATLQGQQLEIKPISKGERHAYFSQKTANEKKAFLESLLTKKYDSEIKNIRQNKKQGLHI